VYRRPCINAIRFQCPFVGELLPRKNETDLIHLNSLLFLQRLLYGEDLIFGFEVERLLSARECFDEDLRRVVCVVCVDAVAVIGFVCRLLLIFRDGLWHGGGRQQSVV